MMGIKKPKAPAQVKVGQVWRNTTRGYRVQVMSILGGVAQCFNLDSERRSNIAVNRFNTHCHWALHRDVPKPSDPVVATPEML